MEQGRRLLLLCVAAAMLLCTLSGCRQPATRGELIDWFQENYTDAPLVVSREKVEDREAGTVSYAAYLKDAPELVFHLQSKRVYAGEHAEFRNVTDFIQVYGAHYFAQYQEQHSVQYWRPNEEYAFYNFPLEALYGTPAELDAAVDELLDIHRFLAEQTPAVTEKYVFTFRSPVCAPVRFRDSLGSDTLALRSDSGEAEALIRQKVKDLRSELAVWCGFYGLHPEWFSEEEMKQALAYTQTEDYSGSSVYIGAWSVSAQEKGELRIPLVAPNAWTFSFSQLYLLLSAVGWETLEGSETDFTFLGADGCTYALSYALWEDEDGNLVNRCAKDGVPMDIDDGCFSSYSLLTDMTGIVLQEQNGTTYRGPGDDGTAHLPAGPGN